MQVFFKEKTEADDIIAILSKLNGKHLIYSGDKDLLQLIYHNKKDKNRKVDYYDFNKNMFVNKDYETIQNLKNIHILMGDRVDDIPKINWNSETTIKFNKWIYDNYKIEMNNKILNKMLKENNILFNLFEKENKNIKIFKNPRLGKITAKKIIETNSLERYLESNEILKRNFELNKKIIDLNYIPNEIKDNILLEFQNYKIKFPNNKKLFEYCDIHNLDKLKKIIKKINS
jgi:5'-3' exonuclease